VSERDLWYDSVSQPGETGPVLSLLDLAVPSLRVRREEPGFSSVVDARISALLRVHLQRPDGRNDVLLDMLA